MALLREGIAAANDRAAQIQKSGRELAAISSDIMTYLNGNANFQVFRNGTERGAAIYNDLNQCVRTLVERLVPTIDRVVASTSNLVEHQQNLNKAETLSNNERQGM